MAKGETYEEFVEKFEPKKTTDDCYTPPIIYEAVADWVAKEYGLDKSKFVRPFWPGGDYQAFDYKEGDVVVDNPPFSIMSKIVRYYSEHRIKYFLFAPALTMIDSAHEVKNKTIIPLGASIIYENGANVSTSFVTNLDGTALIKTSPELYKTLKDANERNKRMIKGVELPTYKYPDNILTVSDVNAFSRDGVDFSVNRNECVMIRRLDSQKLLKKEMYGAGLLLSDAKAKELKEKKKERQIKEIQRKEKEAEEKAVKAIVWELSERERGIIEELNKKSEIVQ